MTRTVVNRASEAGLKAGEWRKIVDEELWIKQTAAILGVPIEQIKG